MAIPNSYWKDALEAVQGGGSGLRRYPVPMGIASSSSPSSGGFFQQVGNAGARSAVPVSAAAHMAAAARTPGAPMPGGWAGTGAATPKTPSALKALLAKHPTLAAMGPTAIAMIAEQLIGNLMGKHHELGMQDIQRQGIQEMGEATTDPQANYYAAMLPQYEQQEEQSRMALMQTIMGGQAGRLANGQESFGGV